MLVTERGYRSWRSRPISRRDRTDMKVLAHIREQYRLSLGSYGRPRMTMELKEAGLAVGERRIGRLMRLNGIKPVRTRKHKVTTDSHHSLGIAANWLDGDFVDCCDDESFTSLLVLEGEGALCCGDESVCAVKGDSFFLPAESGDYSLCGSGMSVMRTRVGTL